MAVSKWDWNNANPSTLHDAQDSGGRNYYYSDWHFVYVEGEHRVSFAPVYFKATQAQVRAAHSALVNKEAASNFNQRVWNDIADKIAELQIEWGTSRGNSVASTTAVRDPESPYVSSEEELYIYDDSAYPPVLNHVNNGRRLTAHKFNLLVDAFKVLPGDWTWSWDAEGVTIRTGTGVKGVYILDLIRAINNWCDAEQLDMGQCTFVLSDPQVLASPRLSDTFPFTAEGEFTTDVQINPEIIDALGIVFQDIIASTEITADVGQIDSIPMRTTFVFTTNQQGQVDTGTAMPVQYSGSVSDEGFQIDVFVRFSNEITFDVAMTFPFEVTEDNVVLFDSEHITIDIDTETYVAATARLGAAQSLENIRLLFTFDADCDIINMNPSMHLQSDLAKIRFGATSRLTQSLTQYIDSGASQICVASNSTLLSGLLEPITVNSTVTVASNTKLFIGYAEKVTAATVDELRSLAELNSGKSAQAESDTSIYAIAESLAAAYDSIRVGSREQIAVFDEASALVKLAAKLSSLRNDVVVSVSASALAKLSLLVGASAQTNVSSLAQVIQAMALQVGGRGSSGVESTAVAVSGAAEKITGDARVELEHRASARLGVGIHVGTLTSLVCDAAASATSCLSRTMEAQASVSTQSVSQIEPKITRKIYGSDEALTILEDVALAQKRPNKMGINEDLFDDIGTGSLSLKDIDKLIANTYALVGSGEGQAQLNKGKRLVVQSTININDVATGITGMHSGISSSGTIGFGTSAVLSCITVGETLVVTLDPYLASALDNYDVHTLETNF